MNNNNTEQPRQISKSTRSINHDEDFNLSNVFYQLWLGKRIILVTVLFMMACCTAFLSLQGKKWTSTSVVTIPSIGQVTNYDAILSELYARFPQDKWPLNSLQKQLFDSFTTSMMSYTTNFPDQPASFVLNIQPVEKDQKAPRRISVTSTSAKQAQDALLKAVNDVNAYIVGEYISDMKRTLQQKESELTQSLKAQISIAESQRQQRLAAYKNALTVAEASGVDSTPLRQVENLNDDTLFLLGTAALKAMIDNEKNKPAVLDKKYFETKQQLFLINNLQAQSGALQSYSYVQKPHLPAQPDSKRVMLKLLLSIFAGVVVGSFVVIGRSVIRDYSSRTA